MPTLDQLAWRLYDAECIYRNVMTWPWKTLPEGEKGHWRAFALRAATGLGVAIGATAQGGRP